MAFVARRAHHPIGKIHRRRQCHRYRHLRRVVMPSMPSILRHSWSLTSAIEILPSTAVILVFEQIHTSPSTVSLVAANCHDHCLRFLMPIIKRLCHQWSMPSIIIAVTFDHRCNQLSTSVDHAIHHHRLHLKTSTQTISHSPVALCPNISLESGWLNRDS